ncbi:hypothetical protein [Maricaulis sp.]
MTKTPTPPRKAASAGDPDSREARLAAALRANLRRRKADRAAPVQTADDPADESSEAPTAQASAIPATKNPRDGS